MDEEQLDTESVLQQRREELGLTLQEAAANCRTTLAMFRQIELGFKPSEYTATKIEKALAMTPGSIVRGEENRCPECDWLAPRHRPGCSYGDGHSPD